MTSAPPADLDPGAQAERSAAQPAGTGVPDQPGLEGLEEKWAKRWAEQQTYAFVRPQRREQVYSIDTPPPTVSGSLHVGHIFSYTHTDVIARFHRMRGKHVFYPIGWDDNGLPTERRGQNYYGVRCDPTVEYDPNFSPATTRDQSSSKGSKSGQRDVAISRRNFVELCHELTQLDEQIFEQMWRRVGLSVDWSTLYTTISDDSRRVAQLAFLRNLERNEAYLAEAPTVWDVTFQTAVAQAELESRDYPGAYHRVGFHRSDSEPIWIETTRPELLPACVALIAHPEDERYQSLFGSTVTSPLFGVELPVLAHPAAEPDKGAGIAMCCTFGDLTDVMWWRELNLPTRTVIGRDGRILREVPQWVSAAQQGISLYSELAGKTVHSARELTVAALRESGDLDGEPKATTRKANFYENGDKPLEVVSTRQWYLRNGGRDEALKQTMLARGEELDWTPAHMKYRYENWVSGLNGDWLISRQRFFGVPFPIWYRLDADGEPDYDQPIVPATESLPIDPFSDVPPGFSAEQRDTPGGFTSDPDVMDTWATSSLTPHIVCGWERDPELFQLTFPMDLDSHAHEIIRTWLFSRIVRAQLENDSLPWTHAMISGFVVDPDRKKMSKSKGNAVVPDEILDKFGSDAVRWRAAMARPGADSPFDEKQMKVGRRLAVKVLNASRFVLGMAEISHGSAEITEPIDQALLSALAQVITTATSRFEAYDYTGALEVTEAFFWQFCDDYVELIKERAYGSQGPAAAGSAQQTLSVALTAVLRLLAPIMPFVTEEVWSWTHAESIHHESWPTTDELPNTGDVRLLDDLASALIGIRGAKSKAKVSMKTEITRATITGPAEALDRLRTVEQDLRAVGRIIGELTYEPSDDPLTVTVELVASEAVTA